MMRSEMRAHHVSFSKKGADPRFVRHRSFREQNIRQSGWRSRAIPPATRRRIGHGRRERPLYFDGSPKPLDEDILAPRP